MPRRNRKVKKKTPKKQPADVPALLERASALLGQGQPERASELFQQALTQQPDNPDILDMVAEARLQLGDAETAFKMLSKSAQLAPTANHSKWMYLGQLQQGAEALECFSRGIQILTATRDRVAQESKSEDAKAEIRSLCIELSTAHVHISELYVRDLCDVPEAESQCEAHIQAALEAAPESPEALHTLANLRFIQRRADDSKNAMGQCLQALGAEGADELYGVSYESRSNMAKLCMELGNFVAAVELLERLLQENDSILEHWYLAGVCYLHDGQPHAAVQYLQAAKDKLESVMQMLNDQEKQLHVSVCQTLAQAQAQTQNTPTPQESQAQGGMDIS